VKKRNLIVALLCLLAVGTAKAQNDLGMFLMRSLQDGFFLFSQEYQLQNEDDEPVRNKPGKEYYGRLFCCGIAVEGENLLVDRNFIRPWTDDKTITKSKKYHTAVSATNLMEFGSLEFDEFDTDVEGATEVVEDYCYSISGAGKEGFKIDNHYGKKRGYAVWLVSASPFDMEKAPTKVSLKIATMNITTSESKQVYNMPSQPTGNIIGGAFLLPVSEGVGRISFAINGIFAKVGGVWKFVSLGTEEAEEDDEDE